MPASADEFEREHIITGSTIIYASGNKFTLFSNKILSLARQNGFRIFDEKLFVDFIRGLVMMAFNSRRYTNIPYFVTGYDRDDKYANFDAVKEFLLYKTTDRNLTKRHIDNVYSYIQKRPSAGMLFLYGLLSITHYPLTKLYSEFNNYQIRSLNYSGHKRAVRDDVNLFANFFGSNMTTDYCATLDSASYSLSKYAIFKDVPLVVRKLHEQLTSRNKDLRELVDLRYNNTIGFYPVIISQSPVKLAEILSIPCSNNRSITKEFRQECKKSLGLIFRTVIENIGNNLKIPEWMIDLNISVDDSYCDYDIACLRTIVFKSLDLFNMIVEKYCSCTDLSALLRQILDDFTLDKNLIIFPPTEYLSENNPDSLQNKLISKVLEFVKATYCEHKDDTSQKTVFVRSETQDIDLNKFFPQMHDNRIICVDNKFLEKFIKNKIKQPSIQVKRLLFDKNLIIKSKDGKRFTQNKSTKSIPCVCFYAEPLQLDDRNDHLTLM